MARCLPKSGRACAVGGALWIADIVELLEAGFRDVEAPHKNGCFAAFGALV